MKMGGGGKKTKICLQALRKTLCKTLFLRRINNQDSDGLVKVGGGLIFSKQP